MKKPLIGLTPQYDGECARTATPIRYITVLKRLGALTAVLPVYEDPGDIARYAEICDGILFTGGDDVDPALFGQKVDEKCGLITRYRDDFEIALLRETMKLGKPVFGICRGIQVMNVAMGGSLCQHGDGHMGVFHHVDIKHGSLAEKLTGTTSLETNSYHHQYVTRPGEGVEITARGTDGVAEAIEIPGYPFFFATQWHPEMSSPECYSRENVGKERLDEYSLKIIGAFVESCAENMK